MSCDIFDTTGKNIPIFKTNGITFVELTFPHIFVANTIIRLNKNQKVYFEKI